LFKTVSSNVTSVQNLIYETAVAKSRLFQDTVCEKRSSITFLWSKPNGIRVEDALKEMSSNPNKLKI